jgi:hypothetical protein
MKYKNRSWQRFAIAGWLVLSMLSGLAFTGCGSDNQTGIWVRIVSPDVTITYVHLYIYDATSFETTPVMDVKVPEPPLPTARKFDLASDIAENQLWVLIFAGADVDERINILGVGYRDNNEVATGNLENIAFVSGQIADLSDPEFFLVLEGCTDKDEDGFCPPNDCDDEDSEVHPAATELCDNLDNNCNGSTDESECPCPPGQERACWPHWADEPVTLCMQENNPDCPCVKGVQTCDDGLWGLCQGLVTPVAEGQTTIVDEREIGVECEEGGYACYDNCSDLVDNDCDFFINEKDIGCGGCNPGDSESCFDADEMYLEHPPCQRGQRWCSDDASWGPCQGQVLPLGFDPDDPENSDISEQGECNGFDDDCDGDTDNVVWLEPCTKYQGCCSQAKMRCVGGVWVDCDDIEYAQFAHDECYSPLLGDDYEYYTLDETTEHCDALDNDCNGMPDDVYEKDQFGEDILDQPLCDCTAGQTAVCETTDEGECVAGDFICVDGSLVMDQFCVQRLEETCDNLDNDCDATTDLNEAARLDCLAAIGQQEHAAVTRCIQGVCQCECDRDNGWWDNDGDLCTLDGGCEYLCFQTAGAVERCDTNDNNCNGSIDAADPLASVDTLCPARPGTKIAGRGGEPGEPADACIGGICQFNCVDPYDDCNGDVRLPVPLPGENDISNGCEVDLTDDPNHCGVCDNVCFFSNASTYCSEFTCILSGCNSNWGNCDNQDANGCETNLLTTNNHCGSCNNDCAQNAHCSVGICACNTGYRNCDTSWSNGCEIDIVNDENNCGSCGNQCGQHAWCNNRNCACDPNWGNCVGGWTDGCETDLQTNDNHCSVCNNSCGQNAYCSSSNCNCNPSWQNCDNDWDDGCEIQTTTDPQHCGTCNVPCNLPNVNQHGCSDSSCTIVSCDSGWTQCDSNTPNGCETHTDVDENNCGSCDNDCGQNAHCTDGSCECDSNFGNCDGDWSDGCEIDFRTNDAHCGSCNFNCGQNAGCSSSTCSCDSSDWGNCSGGWTDGCETDLRVTDEHCGSCNFNCGQNAGCSSSTCSCDSSDWGNCINGWADGCETDLRVTDAHCGSCNFNCGQNAGCSSSLCSCDSSDWGNCSGGWADGCETDLRTTDDHCGLCNFSCGQNATCAASNCGCNGGFANCSGGWFDGCETTLGTDSNCSDCGDSCGSGVYCNGSNCAACNLPNHCGPSCTDCSSQSNNQDCVDAGGWRCGCSDDNDCQNGFYCNTSSLCVACTADDNCGSSCDDCAAGSSNQICVDIGGGNYQCGCSDGGDCDSGEYCAVDTCAACTLPAACGPSCTDCASQANNQDCIDDSGYRCGCDNDNDCQTGFYCNLGTNLCAICTTNNNCGASCDDCASASTNKICVDIGGAVFQCGCSTSAHCDTGEYCNGDTCAACTIHTACGSSCTDCAAQTENQACVYIDPNYQCGCINPSDCDGTGCTNNVCD